MRWDARGCETVLNATMLAVGNEASRSGAEVLLVAVPLTEYIGGKECWTHEGSADGKRRYTTVRAAILPLTHPPIQAHVVANEWLGLPTLCGGISTYTPHPRICTPCCGSRVCLGRSTPAPVSDGSPDGHCCCATP